MSVEMQLPTPSQAPVHQAGRDSDLLATDHVYQVTLTGWKSEDGNMRSPLLLNVASPEFAVALAKHESNEEKPRRSRKKAEEPVAETGAEAPKKRTRKKAAETPVEPVIEAPTARPKLALKGGFWKAHNGADKLFPEVMRRVTIEGPVTEARFSEMVETVVLERMESMKQEPDDLVTVLKSWWPQVHACATQRLLYRKGRLGLPAHYLFQCLGNALRYDRMHQKNISKDWLDAAACLSLQTDFLPFSGNQAWVVDRRDGNNDGVRQTVVRPRLDDWELTFQVQVDTQVLSPAGFRRLLSVAGHFVGLGSFRPELMKDEAEGIFFGQFRTKEIKRIDD